MGKLILLVDDSATIQQLVRLAFADEAIEVLVASTAGQARDWLESRPPDLILTDISLPDGDGLAFVRTLRLRPDTARTPVVVLAPSSTEPSLLRLAGADAVLFKPFESIALLVDTVRDLAAHPSQLELPPASHFPSAPSAVDSEMDSILELDDPVRLPPAGHGATPDDQMINSMVPMLVEQVASRLVELLRERLIREVIERAVPEVVRSVREILPNDAPSLSKSTSDIDEPPENHDH
ncbi:MAG: response regulator [Acidobacteriota bacterium]